MQNFSLEIAFNLLLLPFTTNNLNYLLPLTYLIQHITPYLPCKSTHMKCAHLLMFKLNTVLLLKLKLCQVATITNKT